MDISGKVIFNTTVGREPWITKFEASLGVFAEMEIPTEDLQENKKAVINHSKESLIREIEWKIYRRNYELHRKTRKLLTEISSDIMGTHTSTNLREALVKRLDDMQELREELLEVVEN